MAGLHGILAWGVAAVVVALVVVAALTATGRVASYRLLDRAILVEAGAAAIAAVAGLAVALTAAPPRDALHLLYGAVVAIAPVAARLAAQGRDARSIGRWVLAAAVVALGATVRSFMTGS